MSRTTTPWTLPDKTVQRASQADREIRISDFLLVGALPMRSVDIAGVLPLNEITVAALVGLCLFRRSRGGAKLPFLAALMTTGLLGILLYSGLNNAEPAWTRRMGHMAIVAGVVWAGGTGRISVRSAGAGLAVGLIGVIGLALVGIPGGAYGGRLTGFLADPNAAAYYIAVLGILAIFFADERLKVRVAIAVPLLAGLVLCYSRTGLLAGAFAIAWLVVGRRLGLLGGAAIAAGLVWFVDNIPASLVTFGPFSDRSGSDKLRERIIAQEHVQLDQIPWFGAGPGSARVRIRDLEFYFHNSYLATRHEGGWLALLLVLGLMVYTFLRLSQQARQGDMRAAAAQAGVLASAAMAVTLGEVLLDTPLFLSIAMGLGQAIAATPAEEPDG